MSTEEMKEAMKEKIDALQENEVEHFFYTIFSEGEKTEKYIDLEKYMPGIFKDNDELLKMLA